VSNVGWGRMTSIFKEWLQIEKNDMKRNFAEFGFPSLGILLTLFYCFTISYRGYFMKDFMLFSVFPIWFITFILMALQFGRAYDRKVRELRRLYDE
jgi:hypothetical protein